MIADYGKIYSIGHKALAELFCDPVVIEEKCDGSQMSFGFINGEFQARSHGKKLDIEYPESLFTAALTQVQALDLKPGYIYRGEVLNRPKHNVLKYDRTPFHNVIIFDIDGGVQNYLSPEEKWAEATRLGLEVVPVLFEGLVDSIETLEQLLTTESCLGGSRIEGFVVKNYHRFGVDGRALMGKWVSERFKETHRHQWKVDNPNRRDIVAGLIESLKTEARWQKAVQYLSEMGQLQGEPKDIGPLIIQVQNDILTECEDTIKQAIFDWAWGQIKRGVIRGLPEWYKGLCRQQLEISTPVETSIEVSIDTSVKMEQLELFTSVK